MRRLPCADEIEDARLETRMRQQAQELDRECATGLDVERCPHCGRSDCLAAPTQDPDDCPRLQRMATEFDR